MTSQTLETDERGRSTIAVVGNVDVHNVDALTASTAELGAHGWIDLSGCTFMDSSGVAWLLAAKKSADARNGSITLVAPSRSVVRLLEMCGLTDVFDIEPAAP